MIARMPGVEPLDAKIATKGKDACEKNREKFCAVSGHMDKTIEHS